MLLSKCESCDKRGLWPRKRKYHFDFLPIGPTISEDKLCGKCFKKVVWAIRKTHNQLKPPLTFIIKFYIIKTIKHPKLILKQIYDKFRK